MLTEAAEEAAVDTEALELVEEVLCRQPKDASEEAVLSLDDSSVRATLSRFEP